ncbi:MAG: carbohydrate kinase family protein [Chloroflexi bacterium]|nr:MAG: carbohydrate kinase family protein [Chloroflexota bacterium]
MPDVIVIGDINIDVNLTIPSFPMPGHEAVATTAQMHTGGSAVNTAIALARMDIDVGFIGRVGKDALAEKALADLRAAGVDCSQVQVDPAVGTGLIFIAVTPDGERTMFGARGANVFTDPAAIDSAYFQNCRWLHLSGYSFLAYHQYQTVLAALDLAESTPYTRVSLDVGTEPALKARRQILELLPRLDVIFPNETELTLLGNGRPVPQCLDYLMDGRGSCAVVTKQGARGSLLAVGDKRAVIPAFEVEVRDTTGAGDCFDAGVVMGRLVGLSWEASVALGNALGGWAATFEGAGASHIDRNVVARLVEKHLFKEQWAPVRFALEELAVYFEGPL